MIDIFSAAISNSSNLSTLMEYPRNTFSPDMWVVYDVLKEIYDENIPASLQSVIMRLDERGAGEAGNKLLSAQPVINFEHVLVELKRKRLKEELYLIAKDMQSAYERKEMSFKGMVERIIEIYGTLTDARGDDIFCLGDAGSLDDIFSKHRYYKTGIGPLDKKITGIFDGQLCIVAGRPGRGKSTLLLQLIKGLGLKTLIFSLEMKWPELYAKYLSAQAGVESWKIEAKRLEEDEIKNVIDAQLYLRDYMRQIVVCDRDVNFARIKSISKKMIERNNIKCIAVDYLQLITGAHGDNQNLRIANMTREFKKIAHDNDIPFILLSQLSRESDKAGRRPCLSDLRDSGAIEQDADVVLFVHEDKDEKFELIVDKNRKGKTGYIDDIIYDKRLNKFVEYYNVTGGFG